MDGHLLPGAPAAGHGDEEGGAGHRGATSQVLQVRQVVPEEPPTVQEGPEGRRLQGRLVQVGVEQDVLEDLGAEAVDAPELGLPQHEGLVVHRAEELQQGPGIEVGGVLHPHRDDGAGQEERAGRFQDGELLLHLDPVHVQVRDDRGRAAPPPPPGTSALGLGDGEDGGEVHVRYPVVREVPRQGLLLHPPPVQPEPAVQVPLPVVVVRPPPPPPRRRRRPCRSGRPFPPPPSPRRRCPPGRRGGRARSHGNSGTSPRCHRGSRTPGPSRNRPGPDRRDDVELRPVRSSGGPARRGQLGQVARVPASGEDDVLPDVDVGPEGVRHRLEEAGDDQDLPLGPVRALDGGWGGGEGRGVLPGLGDVEVRIELVRRLLLDVHVHHAPAPVQSAPLLAPPPPSRPGGPVEHASDPARRSSSPVRYGKEERDRDQDAPVEAGDLGAGGGGGGGGAAPEPDEPPPPPRPRSPRSHPGPGTPPRPGPGW